MTGGSSARTPQLWLARHGQTEDNRAGDIFQGFRDTPLNDTGRAQARALAQRLADDPDLQVTRMRCSDLRRAEETAAIVADVLGLVPEPDPRLREGNRGDWEGRRFSEVERDEPEAYAAWLAAGPEFRFPGGESLLEQQTRVLAALDDVSALQRADPDGGDALVVCHRGSIRVALCSRDPRGLAAFHLHDVENTGVVRW